MDRRERVEEAVPALASVPADPELSGGGAEIEGGRLQVVHQSLMPSPVLMARYMLSVGAATQIRWMRSVAMSALKSSDWPLGKAPVSVEGRLFLGRHRGLGPFFRVFGALFIAGVVTQPALHFGLAPTP